MNKCDKIIYVRIDLFDKQGYVYVFNLKFLSKKDDDLIEDCAAIFMWLALEECEEINLTFCFEDVSQTKPSYYTDDFIRSISASTRFGNGGLTNFLTWLPIDIEIKTASSIITSK